MVSFWNPVDETERPRWTVAPFVSVGPLRFGMSPDEVVAALGGASPVRWRPGHHAEFGEVAVTAYYGDQERLMCVAVDALSGPQVTLDGTSLVGRPPSEVMDGLLRYAESRRLDHRFSQEGDVALEEAGLVMRAQRAGDVLLTRPVFVAREWAEGVGDAQLGPVPDEEWSVR